MIKKLQYQQQAIKELVEKALKLLHSPGERKKLIFQAPTGSGKTVMISEAMAQLMTEIDSDPTLTPPTYIWVAPNKLHQQSLEKMKAFFDETHTLRATTYDGCNHSVGDHLPEGQILFVNWESINKDKNILVRDSEGAASLYDLTDRTKEEDIPIIVIIDEEHLYAGASAIQAQKVLRRINPKLEIRISATPNKQDLHEKVTVQRNDVIAEQMIKKGIVLNPALDVTREDVDGLTELLIDHALAKRDELAEAYRKQGSRVNPLLLIQLPNDGSEKVTEEETRIINSVKTVLEVKYDITTTNALLGIWLSKEKENLDGIEREDNLTKALLFKQAIALGWDCPRAAVLLIFRKMESMQFTMQTVGRILRMPEHKHYMDPQLNQGYVYTDLSKDKISIVADDIDYFAKNETAYIKDGLENVTLKSVYRERLSEERNRLLPNFGELLQQHFAKKLLGHAHQQTLDFQLFEDE
ncbi:MAG: DEAD/DEAH box helicase family protein [Bacteroidales bacterium]|nr:DEAD/DEAH box helicase family protein [Bacteroidales bacterium]